MEIKDYYRFGSKLSSATFQAHVANVSEDRKTLDYQWRLLMGDSVANNSPVVFKQEQGYKLYDVLDTGWPSLYLISDKIKIFLEENELTGWAIFPVKLYDKKQHEVEGYNGLSITGRCGPVDYSKSAIIKKSMIEGGPISNYYKGLYIGLDDWDGSDFFMPKGLFVPIVTKKVMQKMNKAKLTNIRFENLAEIKTWEVTVDFHQENISKNIGYF